MTCLLRHLRSLFQGPAGYQGGPGIEIDSHMSYDNAVFNFLLSCNLVCVASFPFSGRRDQTSKPEVSKIRGEVGRGEREGEGGGGGEKRNDLWSIPNILPNSVSPRTGSNSAI